MLGAVGGRYVVLNPDNALTLSTKFYRDPEHVLRTGEAALCSACLFDGEINAWRKGLIDIDPRMIAEDLDVCIKMRDASFYHSLTVLACVGVFVAGLVLISYGVWYALIAVFSASLLFTYAKKIEEGYLQKKEL